MIGEVAFRVNQDCRDALQGSFFQEDNAHARLARASHAGDNRMGRQIGRVIKDGFFGYGLPGN